MDAPYPLSDIADRLLGAAQAAGADAADTVVTEDMSLSVDVLNGALEHAERSEGREAGLRVFVGKRQACVSAASFSDTSIAAMAERAVAMARTAPEDRFSGLAEPSDLARAWDIDAFELNDPAPEREPAELKDDALAAEASALQVAGVTKVASATAAVGRRRFHLSASNGFSGGYTRSSQHVSCVAITGHGTEMERDYFGEVRTFRADLPPPDEIGRVAGERAVARAGARKPPTGAFPVLFDERVASSLIGHLLSAVNGSAVARGASWLSDAMGEPILPSGLSVIEEPHRPRVSGSKPFDAEGLPTRNRYIVEDGRLVGWTLDLATGRQLDMQSTANAARGGAQPPSPANHNITLTQGGSDPVGLMRDMGQGLLVTSMIGASISPTTGDYSRGASGFWIENGEVTYPVNECTVAGNLRDLLRTLVPSNDARTHQSRVIPSCLVEGLTIAGE